MPVDPAKVYRQLQKRARARGVTTQQQIELYIHERLLARVAASRFADRLVLKGGMLLAALDLRDVTRDADILMRATSNDPEHVRQLVAEVVAIALNDGVEFDAAGITVETMREDHDYHGLRIRIPGVLHSARINGQIDASFGDPVEGHRRTISAMLGGEMGHPSFSMLTYSIESVLAEKIVTMLSRGDANTRDRDFGDVWLIGSSLEIDGSQLRDALVATGLHREVPLTPLSAAVVELPQLRDDSWRRYRRRTRLARLPDDFRAVVGFVARLADPPLITEAFGGTWSPVDLAWMPDGVLPHRPEQ